MVHLVRNSLRFIPTKHYKEFRADARAICAAVSAATVQEVLFALQEKWADYPSAIKIWTSNFELVQRLFELPTTIRRMVYTTNLVEGFHSGLRKVIRGKAAFPNDDSVFKTDHLSARDGYAEKVDVACAQLVSRLGTYRHLFPGFDLLSSLRFLS